MDGNDAPRSLVRSFTGRLSRVSAQPDRVATGQSIHVRARATSVIPRLNPPPRSLGSLLREMRNLPEVALRVLEKSVPLSVASGRRRLHKPNSLLT
jgi:hypothetical protein